MDPVQFDKRLDAALDQAEAYFRRSSQLTFHPQYRTDFKELWMNHDVFCTGVLLNLHSVQLLSGELAARGWQDWASVSPTEQANYAQTMNVQGCITVEQVLRISEDSQFRPPHLPPQQLGSNFASFVGAAAAAASFAPPPPPAAVPAFGGGQVHHFQQARRQNCNGQHFVGIGPNQLPNEEVDAAKRQGDVLFEYVDESCTSTVLVTNTVTNDLVAACSPPDYGCTCPRTSLLPPTVVPEGLDHPAVAAIVANLDNIKIAASNHNGSIRLNIDARCKGEGMILHCDSSFLKDSDNQLSMLQLSGCALAMLSEPKRALEARIANLIAALGDE